MYAPYPENMMESIKKVEATRAQRMTTEPRRLSADEKDALLKKFHPDYNPDAFAEIKVGPNKGQKAPLELAEMLHSESRLPVSYTHLFHGRHNGQVSWYGVFFTEEIYVYHIFHVVGSFLLLIQPVRLVKWVSRTCPSQRSAELIANCD